MGLLDVITSGGLTPWLVVGGLLAAWLAIKAVKGIIRFALMTLAAGLWLGVVPLSGIDLPATPGNLPPSEPAMEFPAAPMVTETPSP